MITAGIGFLFAFVLIFFRIPIALSLALTGVLGFAVAAGWPQAFVMLAHSARDSSMSYGLSVLPLFVLMGNLVAGAGISQELYRAANAFLGHRRGGLAVATIVSCGGFAAVCGSSVATAVTMGKVSLPSMRKLGYSDQLSTATIAAGATLGILIPPSVIMVIYGIITESHIGKLYAAGFIPGLLGVLLYIGAVRWVVWRNPNAAPPAQKAPLSEKLASIKDVWAVTLLFVVVLGGIYAGVFTATEAAGIGASGAFVLSLVRGRLTFAKLKEIFFDTAQTSTIMFALLMGATVFGEFLNYTGAHEALLTLVRDMGLSPALVIFVIIVIYVIMGCLMESLSMILLTVPLFFPIVVGLGFDPIWFGILLVVLVEIGLITPPIGVNLFVLRSVAPEVSMSTIIRGIIPFIVVDVFRIAIIAIFPIVSLFLPNLFFGK